VKNGIQYPNFFYWISAGAGMTMGDASIPKIVQIRFI